MTTGSDRNFLCLRELLIILHDSFLMLEWQNTIGSILATLVAFVADDLQTSFLWWPLERHALFHRLSTYPGRRLVTRSGMRDAATLCFNDGIKNFLSCSSSFDSLERVMESMNDEDQSVAIIHQMSHCVFIFRNWLAIY